MINKIKDAYTWQVYLSDNTIVPEADNLFAGIDQTKIRQIDLLPTGQGHVHSVQIPQDATPEFFRQRRTAISLMDGQEMPLPTVHCIGWKRGEHLVHLFIYDDGSVLLTDSPQAI